MKSSYLLAALVIQIALAASPVFADDSLMDVSPEGAGTGQMPKKKSKHPLHQEALQACSQSKAQKACTRTYEGSVEACLKVAGVELPPATKPLPDSEKAALNQCKRQALWAL